MPAKSCFERLCSASAAVPAARHRPSTARPERRRATRKQKRQPEAGRNVRKFVAWERPPLHPSRGQRNAFEIMINSDRGEAEVTLVQDFQARESWPEASLNQASRNLSRYFASGRRQVSLRPKM